MIKEKRLFADPTVELVVKNTTIFNAGLKFPEDFLNKIICGNAINVMKKIPDGSVHLVVTLIIAKKFRKQ